MSYSKKDMIKVDDHIHVNIDKKGEPWDMFVSMWESSSSISVHLNRGNDSFGFYTTSQMESCVDAMKDFLEMWKSKLADNGWEE